MCEKLMRERALLSLDVPVLWNVLYRLTSQRRLFYVRGWSWLLNDGFC